MLENNTLDTQVLGLRGVNQTLKAATEGTFDVYNPQGAHALACGLNHPIEVNIKGHAGYYCAGMNQNAHVTIEGNVGTGLAENMMSGSVRVKGNASQSVGATAHGGLIVVEGSASARCGISMKGVNIVVGGDVGHMSAFMAQAGALVVLGDAGDAFGDSLYEAKLFVQGSVASLGADCKQKKMRKKDIALLRDLLDQAGYHDVPTDGFKRYGSARQLYHFKIDNIASY